MKFWSIGLLLLSLAFLACKKPVEDPGVVLPSNLSTVISVDEGRVDVQASASEANFYTVAFFEGTDSSVVESTDGVADYTFAATGSYTVRTRAHATYADFIEKVEMVSVTVAGSGGGGVPTGGYSTPMSYPNYTLVWNDEFNGSSLSSDWSYEIGTGNNGWGNNESQYYREENVNVSDGLLTITAKEELFGGKNYTSSRIVTRGQKSFMQGRIDIRAVLPYGQGIWPALWMLGDNFGSAGWPHCGEIDIMEMVGGAGNRDRTVHGTIHWDENGSHASYGGSNSLNSGKFADEFHVFSIIWDQNSIKWLRDDVQFREADLTPADLSEFQQNFFFIFNIAVGGNWPGSPDGTTVFPQTMVVDYVRVFQ